jgi:hypothetical protein
LEFDLANDGLDPDTEKALREAMDQAEQDVRADGIVSMATYLKTAMDAYTNVGFTQEQAFELTRDLYKGLLTR